MEHVSRILIIGYGNPLRGDDGLGWHVAERLRGGPAEVLALHQLTPELADPLSRADLAIFVDAACDNSPGAIGYRRIEPESAPSEVFSHQFTPEVLLGFATKLYGRRPEAVLLSIGGASFECGEQLSSAVQSAVPELLARVQQLIDHQRGIVNEETEATRR